MKVLLLAIFVAIAVFWLTMALYRWDPPEGQAPSQGYQYQETTQEQTIAPASLQEETTGPTENYLPPTGGPS